MVATVTAVTIRNRKLNRAEFEATVRDLNMVSVESDGDEFEASSSISHFWIYITVFFQLPIKPPKRKAKKRSLPNTDPTDVLDQDRKDEIRMTFQYALKKGESESKKNRGTFPVVQFLSMASETLFIATLSISRAKKALKNLGLESTSDEIQSFFGGSEEDPNRIENLDEASYLSFAASKTIQKEKAHKAFELMDQDGKGVVVLEDLQRVAEELGEDMSPDELEEMIHLANKSGDGLLTAQDFIRLARKVNL